MNEAIQHLNGAFSLVVPDAILLASACLIFFAAPFLVSERGEAPAGLRHRWGMFSLLAILIAGCAWWQSTPVTRTLGPFILDELTWYVRGLTLVFGAILVLLHWNQADDSRSAESHACLLAILAGVNLIAAANDLVELFVALELVSVPTYLFLLLPRRDAPAQEATLKYFLLSIFSSAFVLFGMSYLYGVTGTTNLAAIHAALTAGPHPINSLVTVATVMIIAGLGFRLTAVPFHFYAPDVFQGAPTSSAAMLSFIPKVAGLVALLRLLVPATGSDEILTAWSITPAAVPVLWWLAVITMFVGNLMALLQTDIRRLLAYSSVSHAGYMMVGLIVGMEHEFHKETGTLAEGVTRNAVSGIGAMLFYLAVYGSMTLGTFAVLIAASRKNKRIETYDDLNGLSHHRPALALILSVFLFSLAGLPPTAGLLGKLNLFFAAWSQGSEGSKQLAVILAINAVLGAWYYLKIIGVMFLRDPVDRSEYDSQPETPSLIAAGLCLIGTIGLFFLPGWLWTPIQSIMP
ncbi:MULTISPECIES: NADH-quinone oxidoreductase subunit N [unclassified Schlesneria]|uniref:NADH-quinone oxidoreductase subunit N n=1 Tax=Schlesneria TaxID=656899 RepID=UPI002F022745